MARAKRNERYLDSDLQRELIDRLTSIEGHVRGVRRMLEERKSCDRILVQMAAIKAAVNQTSMKLLEGHMESCVKDLVHDEEGRRAIDSLRAALASALKS
ncbi:MAG: metal-sensitive transcriptional regulator [Nitrospinota bacterium]